MIMIIIISIIMIMLMIIYRDYSLKTEVVLVLIQS